MGDDRAILVIGPNWVGDMVMAQGLFGALKQADPTAAIDVMAPRWAASLLARMPEVRAWLEAPFARRRLELGARFRTGVALRGRYGTAYVLPGSWKSALVPFCAGIPRRIGYRREWRFGLLNDLRPLPAGIRRRTAEMFVRLAGTGTFRPPALRVDAANQADLLAAHGLGGQAFVALMPGAEYGASKRWPPPHYAALAQALATRGLRVVLLGSARDVAVTAAIGALAPETLDLAGRTRLEDAIDLLAAARVAVSNDSGLMHVAAAVGTPVVAIFGSTSPDNTPPLTERAALLTRRLACSPCHARTCRFGHYACLEGVAPAEVLAATDRLMALP